MPGLNEDQAQVLLRPVVGIDAMYSYADINPKDATDTLRRLADTGRVGWLAEPKE